MTTNPVAPPSAFTVDFSIRMSDLSVSHHVNNVSFLRYLDEARAIFFGASLGSTGFTGGILEAVGESVIPIVARNEVEYRREVWPADGPVTLRLWVPYVGGSSLVVAAEATTAGSEEPCAVFESTVVLVSRATGVPWRVDDAARRVFEVHGGPRPPMRPRAGLA